MIDCGHIREDQNGSISACWMWCDCPHQPHYEYQVWMYSERGDMPEMIGQYRSRLDARRAELATPAERYTEIRTVQVFPPR